MIFKRDLFNAIADTGYDVAVLRADVRHLCDRVQALERKMAKMQQPCVSDKCHKTEKKTKETAKAKAGSSKKV